MQQPINRDLITERMNALGLSERQVTAQLSIGQSAFRDARLRGFLHGHINLRQVGEIARALGLEPHQLLADARDYPHDAPPSVHADVELLIPLLLGVSRLVDAGHLARTLDWRRDRLNQALKAIPSALNSTGLRLVESGTSVTICPADRIDKQTQSRIARVQSRNAGLNASQARMLQRVIRREKVSDRQNSNNDKVALGALKNMACIQLGDKADWEPTSQIRLALMLDD